MTIKTAKTPIWKSIADTLRSELAEGLYRPGQKLPTESELAQRFGVNRHTVRHALTPLLNEGLLRSRRGAGVFVTATPTNYPLGKRVRFHENVAANGRKPEKRILTLSKRKAKADEGAALNTQGEVCVYHGLSFSDRQPIALFESVFPIERLPGIEEAIRHNVAVTAALEEAGVMDFTRVSTRINAVSASATQALHLEVREGDPLIQSTNLNADLNGTPVEFGRTWFAGERVTLTLTPED